MTEQIEQIQVGDHVEVFMSAFGLMVGTVLYIPCQPFDNWIIKSDSGRIFYVQQYECIRKMERNQ